MCHTNNSNQLKVYSVNGEINMMMMMIANAHAHMSQVLRQLETKFQRLYPCFHG